MKSQLFFTPFFRKFFLPIFLLSSFAPSSYCQVDTIQLLEDTRTALYNIIETEGESIGFKICEAEFKAVPIDTESEIPDPCEFNNNEFDIVISSNPFSPFARKISNLNLGNVVSDKKILIKTNLIVDIDFKFEGCDIKVESGKMILVTNDVFFRAVRSKFASCDGLWDGINAAKNGENITLKFWRSEIVGAIGAIATTFPKSVRMEIHHTLFDRNFAGVLCDLAVAANGCHLAQFKGNTFDCTGPIPGTNSTRSVFGLLMNGQIVNHGNDNTFRNQQIGIISNTFGNSYHGNRNRFENIAMDAIFFNHGSIDLNTAHFINYGRNGIGMNLANNVKLRNVNFTLDEDFVPTTTLPSSLFEASPICALGINTLLSAGSLSVTDCSFFAENESEDLFIVGILMGTGSIGANTEIDISESYWNYDTGNFSSCINLFGDFPISSNTSIFQNTFDFDPLLFNSIDAVAILFRQGNKNNIHIIGNTFRGDANTPGKGIGLLLRGSNGQGNEINDNIFPSDYIPCDPFTNLNNCFTQGMRMGLVALDFRGLKFCSNDISNSSTGTWFVGAGMNTEIVGNRYEGGGSQLSFNLAMLGNQNFTGNTFNPRIAPPGFLIGTSINALLNPDSNPILNRYTVHTAQSTTDNPFEPGFSEYYPPEVIPENGWFVPDLNGDPQEHCGSSQLTGDQNDFYSKLIEDNSITQDENPMLFEQRYELYKRIAADPSSFANTPLLLLYYQQQEQGFFGLMLDIEELVEEVTIIPEEIAADINILENSTADILADLDQIEIQIEQDPEGEHTVANNQKVALLESIASNNLEISNLLQSFENAKNGPAVTALNLLNGFNPTNNYQGNYKSNMLAYFEKIVNDGQLIEVRIIELEAIAALCPTDYGMVVYQAQTILSPCNTGVTENCTYPFQEYDQFVEEEGPETREQLSEEKNTIILFPNPTEEIFYLENIPYGSSIQMVNSLGQIVYQEDGTNDSLSIRISKAGIYFLTVTQQEAIIFTDKVIIRTF